MPKSSPDHDRILLVSTCGSSVLANVGSDEDRRWLILRADSATLSPRDTERLEQLAAFAEEKLRQGAEEQQRRLSAEINGIDAVRRRWPGAKFEHVLVCTDTAIGRRCAEILREALRARGDPEPSIFTAAGLRTDNQMNFRTAVSDLTKDLYDHVGEPGSRFWARVVFHLTGGFEWLHAYLQALGTVLADRCVFLFESSAELLEILRLPLVWQMEEAVRKHLDLFRRLAVGYEVPASAVEDAPEALFLEVDGEVSSSVWGETVWQRCRQEILRERLLPPLSSPLRVDPRAQETFAKPPNDRRVAANEALDEFCASLDNARRLRKARKFTALVVPHRGVSTHELYAWSDGGAWRFFLHREGDTYVVDSMEKHL